MRIEGLRCSLAQRLLPGAEDGCLPPGLAAWAQRHARTCPRCAEVLRGAAALRRALGELEVPALTGAASEGLWRRIRATLEDRPGAARDPWAVLRRAKGMAARRPAMAWAAGAALAALALALLIRMPETGQTLKAGLDALTVIQSVEAGINTSVLVLETPRERLHVIWVVEPGAGTPEPPAGKDGSELWPATPARHAHVARSSLSFCFFS